MIMEMTCKLRAKICAEIFNVYPKTVLIIMGIADPLHKSK